VLIVERSPTASVMFRLPDDSSLYSRTIFRQMFRSDSTLSGRRLLVGTRRWNKTVFAAPRHNLGRVPAKQKKAASPFVGSRRIVSVTTELFTARRAKSNGSQTSERNGNSSREFAVLTTAEDSSCTSASDASILLK
jgi:hypothetical protein